MRKYITPFYHIIHYGRRIYHKRNKILFAWWRHQMETLSILLDLCERNYLVTGGFPSQRPMTRGFDVFFDLCLNKRLSKESRRWRYKTPSSSLWRHYILYELYSKPVVHQSRALSMGMYIGRRSWYLILSENRCVQTDLSQQCPPPQHPLCHLLGNGGQITSKCIAEWIMNKLTNTEWNKTCLLKLMAKWLLLAKNSASGAKVCISR